MCLSSEEHPCHLFARCSFASHCWFIMLDAFGWSMTVPNKRDHVLASIFVAHPFRGVEENVVAGLQHSFFSGHFDVKAIGEFSRTLHQILMVCWIYLYFMLFTGAQVSVFSMISLTFLISNWKVLF